MKYLTKLFAGIIIVPLHEIIDNIYKLLSRGPTRHSAWMTVVPPTDPIPEKSLSMILKNAAAELKRSRSAAGESH